VLDANLETFPSGVLVSAFNETAIKEPKKKEKDKKEETPEPKAKKIPAHMRK
jgi:hypothetical protein